MHVYFILCHQFILLGGVHVWLSQNLRGNVPFDYRAFCSELTFKLTPTCFQAAAFTFRLSGEFALKWIFQWTGKTPAFHFNVLTALSRCIASEAGFVKICKQQNPVWFSQADPAYRGRFCTQDVPNFFQRENEMQEPPISGDRSHLNTTDIPRDKPLVRSEGFFLQLTYHFCLLFILPHSLSLYSPHSICTLVVVKGPRWGLHHSLKCLGCEGVLFWPPPLCPPLSSSRLSTSLNLPHLSLRNPQWTRWCFKAAWILRLLM